MSAQEHVSTQLETVMEEADACVQRAGYGDRITQGWRKDARERAADHLRWGTPVAKAAKAVAAWYIAEKHGEKI